MSNAWYYYVVPLGIAAGFVFVGIFSLCLYWLGGRTPDGTRRVSLIQALPGAIFGLAVGGTFGINFLLTSPTPRERERIYDHVFRTPPERIERFVIKAGRPDRCCRLTTADVVIDDPARVRQVAGFLRAAAGKPEAPDHPRSRWIAEVTMVTRDGTYHLLVSATVPGDRNGTTVSPLPAAEGGWNLGSFRADGLERVFEDAVNKAGKPD